MGLYHHIILVILDGDGHTHTQANTHTHIQTFMEKALRNQVRAWFKNAMTTVSILRITTEFVNILTGLIYSLVTGPIRSLLNPSNSYLMISNMVYVVKFQYECDMFLLSGQGRVS